MTEKKMQISPSQVDSYLGCPRRWWWKHVVRMPELESQEQFVFGNVVHSICERYLLADDNGRVPKPPTGTAWTEGPLKGQRMGDAVDLYPDGWDLPLRSPALAGHVRKVVKEAIDAGVLVRQPGRRIEHGYKREVIPGVVMSGRMDVEHPMGIEDHKTTKAAKWCMSEKDLAADPKMLCYAHEWLKRWSERLEEEDPATAASAPDPDAVTLRLNYFSKDPDDPFVKYVDVDVEVDAVEQHWEKAVVPAAEEMLDLAGSGLDEKQWTQVEGPRTKNECRKYGGCAFAPVCSRMRAPAAHRRIIDRANGKRPDPRPRPTATPGGSKMSLFEKARKRSNGIPPTSASEATPPTKAAEDGGGVATVEVDPASIEGKAPWANPHCVACGGSGVNSKNGVCIACDNIAKRKERPSSEDFRVWNDAETGELCWAAKDAEDAKPEGRATRTAKPAETTTRKKVARKRKKAADPAQEVAPEVAPEEPTKTRKLTKVAAKTDEECAAEEAKAPEAEEASAQEPVQVPGLVLLINAVPLRSAGGASVDLHEILAREGAEMAAAVAKQRGKDVDSYYHLDPWARKDLMGRCIGEIARELENTTVVAVGSSQDFKMLVDLLRPYAEQVIVGVF